MKELGEIADGLLARRGDWKTSENRTELICRNSFSWCGDIYWGTLWSVTLGKGCEIESAFREAEHKPRVEL